MAINLPVSFSEKLVRLGMEASQEAGRAILEIYQKDFSTQLKEDGTPVTQADIRSNEIIKNILSRSGYPIISEESDIDLGWDNKTVWIVDPLDGTEDFIKKTGEFSILIGLVQNGVPWLGIVHQPTADFFYIAEQGKGAYLYQPERGAWQKLLVNPNQDVLRTQAIMSRNHISKKEKEFLRFLQIQELKYNGSCGLKMVAVAGGSADFYFTFTDKVNQWDTCAGNCILTEAGGKITDVAGRDLNYTPQSINHQKGLLATNGKIHEAVVQALKNFGQN